MLKKNKIVNIVVNIITYIFVLINFNNYHMIDISNISLYILMFLLYYLFKNTYNIKIDKTSKIFAIVFSLFLTFGNPEMVSLDRILDIISGLVGWYVLFGKIFYLLGKNVNKIKVNTEKKPKKIISKKKFIIISMTIGFLCYLPYLLKYFPGLMNSDSYNQVLQIQGLIDYSNHHPFLHTMIIKIFYDIGYAIFNKEIMGVAFYTIFQMIFVSYVYSYLVYTLYKNKINKYIIMLVWGFFFLFPFNAIYSITMWKDIIFSAVIIWFSIYIWNHYNEHKEWNKKNEIIYIIFGILICLLRSNGLLAYILYTLVLFIIYRKDFLKLKIPIIIVLISSIVIKGPVYNVLNVKKTDLVESLSIPLQQVAYVIRNDGKITEDQMKDLEKIADVDLIKSQKDDWRAQFVSDPVKDNIRNIDKDHYLEKNKGKYLKLWAELGLKNPIKYIRAWIKQTNGYWYHNVDPYVVYILHTQTYNKREGYQLNFKQHDYLPKSVSNLMTSFINNVTLIYYKIWSPAMGLYLTLIALFIMIKRKKNIMPCILNIALVLTLLIATPVSCEFRYAYSLFLSGGLLIILSLNKEVVQ